MATTTNRRNNHYVEGKPPENVNEERTFGAVLSFRAMCCDWCRFAPHDTCQHYQGMRDRVHQEGLFPCGEYRRRD
jgi:hypothetical protein